MHLDFEPLYLRSHPSLLFVGFNTSTKQEQIIEYHGDTHRIVSTNLNLIDLICENKNPSGWTSFDVVGCCNGLFLGHESYQLPASGLYTESLRLVNPITRRSVKLTLSHQPTRRLLHLYGLGYSSTSLLYKLVHLDFDAAGHCIKILTINNADRNRCYYWRSLCCLNNCNNNNQLICDELPQLVPYMESRPLALCGAIHWLVLGNKNTILRFDIDNEEFEFVPMPYKSKTKHLYSQLSALGGLLSVLEADCPRTRFEVWVMKEYGVKESCWTRLTTIKLEKDWQPLNVIYVLENGKSLLIKLGAHLHLYDLVNEEWNDNERPPLKVDVITMKNHVSTNFSRSFLSLAPTY